MEIIIVTGLSGAGKSNAIDCFEDMGYYCTDNLPPSLITDFINLIFQSKSKIQKAVFVMDIRGGEFFDDLYDTLNLLNEKGVRYKMLFLDSETDTLIRRFNETRRSHPLADTNSNAEAIELERQILNPLKRESDYIIDTSDLKPVELALKIRELFGGDNKQQEVQLTVQSFGFKYGLPKEADSVFDVRFIPNPFYVTELKKKNGEDEDVREYVMSSGDAQYLRDSVVEGIIKLIPAYKREGKYQISIAFGCTGGQHRSVAMANVVYKELLHQGIKAKLKHRDL